MNINDRLHGFVVTEIRDLPEISARMVRMTYEKNGADLIWLDRPDENKTFAITFKTIPSDDTGVFHILEHSVLCGSEKYPVKEPFVELLKSSLQTFLNAMTYPDKTMYPVSSRNDKDFLNLMDVYMDAVLHPLSITDPHAFRQEGWHYELDAPDGELICNGVVYNEMKGSFASHEEILQFEMNRQLFPDNCYGCESGGHPDHITELTYENYLASHHRFYHPSNSRIFLDGMVDIDQVLAKLDSYLNGYDRLEPDADIPMQAAVSPEEAVREYEVSEESNDGLILAQGWVYGDFTDKERSYALNILAEVLTGSNESPLSKVLIDEGLAMDVDMQVLDGIQQPYIALILKNTPEDKREEAWSVLEKTLVRIADEGLDHKRVNSALNRLEFLTREKDYGTMPRGLVYAMLAAESWLYGGDPMQNVLAGDVFEKLRAKVDEGYFEDLIRDFMISNPHAAKVTLVPSTTLGAVKLEKERARLADVKAGWTAEETAEVISGFRAFREKQAATDTPEDIASLPVLALEDVPVEIREPEVEMTEVGGVTVLHPIVNTEGIIYLDLYFDLHDMGIRELQTAAVFAKLLGDIATVNYDVNGLQAEIDANLGRLSASISASSKPGDISDATPRLCVTVSLLESKKSEAVRLIREVLLGSVFSDKGYIFNEIRQARIGLEQTVINSGNSFARQRVSAGISAYGALSEALYGIEMLRFVQDLEAGFEKEGDAFCEALSGLAGKVFTRPRLTVGVTGPFDREWVAEVLSFLGEDPAGPEVRYFKESRTAMEGFRIPSAVSFTAKGSNLYAVGEEYTGAASVAAVILTYGYLWNTIRVQGGAYGTGLRMVLNGDALFSSYRDPSGAQSIASFDKAPDALRAIAESGESLDKYIISTIGGQDPLLSPRMEGKKAIMHYFIGQSAADRERIRSEILHTTGGDLIKVAEQLGKVCSGGGVCIIGGAEAIDACGGMLESVEPLQRQLN